MGPLSDFFMGCLIRCIVGQQVAQANWKKKPSRGRCGWGRGETSQTKYLFSGWKSEHIVIIEFLPTRCHAPRQGVAAGLGDGADTKYHNNELKCVARMSKGGRQQRVRTKGQPSAESRSWADVGGTFNLLQIRTQLHGPRGSCCCGKCQVARHGTSSSSATARRIPWRDFWLLSGSQSNHQ